MGKGQVSNQSGTYWYPVITASSCEVAVPIMSFINYVTPVHKRHTRYTTQNSTNTPQISPGEGLQSLIALFLV